MARDGDDALGYELVDSRRAKRHRSQRTTPAARERPYAFRPATEVDDPFSRFQVAEQFRQPREVHGHPPGLIIEQYASFAGDQGLVPGIETTDDLPGGKLDRK
jgi:hypothetical protein